MTITTGDFSSSSGGSGVRIFSDGAITLTDVDATGNIQDGIYLDNSTGAKTAVTIKVTGTNTNNVSNNQGDYGLYVQVEGRDLAFRASMPPTMTAWCTWIMPRSAPRPASP